MLDISDFDQVFHFDLDYSYGSTTYDDILQNRRILHNQLFYDRMLAVLHVKASHLYPPHTNQDLRELHRRIIAAPIAEHHKQSLLYYILLDCKSPNEAQPAEDFSKECFLPKQYWVCVQGLWEMDRLQFKPALEYLTQPSLIPTFPDEILRTLLDHASASDKGLALAYYHTTRPPLTDPPLLSAFFRYLARISVTEAFFFSRQQPDHARRQLLEELIHTTLSLHSGEERAARGIELVDLPFDEEEEGWFEEYLLEGKGRNLHGAADSVVLRRIATGKVQQASSLSKSVAGRRHEGVNWEAVKDGLERGLGSRKGVEAFQL